MRFKTKEYRKSMEEINVGYKFKQIRENAGLTLKQVSAMSGLSVSFISQIERGVVDPSWSSLKKISAALNIKLKDLFDEPPRPYTLVRDGQGYQSVTHHIRREFLASMDNASMEMILTAFPPHSSSGTILPHPGEEFVWILEGTLNVTVDGTTHVMCAGDSIYFQSTYPHEWQNKSGQVCKVLWVDNPPVHM